MIIKKAGKIIKHRKNGNMRYKRFLILCCVCFCAQAEDAFFKNPVLTHRLDGSENGIASLRRDLEYIMSLSDEEILKWVASDAETALHPSCSAKMGRDEMSVVDPDSMKVHGLEGVRVADASVMPYVTNGNIYAPTMMIAEKAADLILGNTPLPAQEVKIYRA